MRIVGGSLRGRRLEAPEGVATRPTSDRTREALFDILAHNSRLAEAAGHWPLDETRVLDVFAGTGALGIEALSRGAREAVFLERDRAALAALNRNIAKLGLLSSCRVMSGDALNPPRAAAVGGPADLVLVDPPYGEGHAEQALEALDAGGWLTDGTVVVFELGPRDVPPQLYGLTLFDVRKFGKPRLAIFVAAKA